jgi:NAD-dependent DNA ligase
MAATLKFLASPDAGFITGACLVADGGSSVNLPDKDFLLTGALRKIYRHKNISIMNKNHPFIYTTISIRFSLSFLSNKCGIKSKKRN